MFRGNTILWLLLICLVVANGLILVLGSASAHTCGGLVLFCLTPGLALMNLVFRRSNRFNLLEWLLLGVATSYALSNLVVLGLTFLPDKMSLRQLVITLDAVSLALITASLLGGRRAGVESEHRGMTWLYVVVLLALLCFLRFVGLGYSQLVSGDEVPLVALATRVIAGTGSALHDHPKGPTEVLTTVGFVLFDNGYREFVMRLPFALASVASILMVYVLGWEISSERVGFIAGLLMSFEGLFLAHSRLDEYHGIVILMAVSAVYCFWRSRSAMEADRERYTFLVLGSAFFAFGCLTHYDGVVLLPVLALLYFSSGLRLHKREILWVLVCFLLAVAIAAPYYGPFIFAQRLSSARTYVVGGRLSLGSGLHNNLATYVFSEMLLRDSIYYVVFMLLALLGAVVSLWRGKVGARALMSLACLAFLVGFMISLCCPGVLQAGPVNFGILFFLPMLAMSVFGTGLRLGDRMTWVWFTTILIVYGFIVRLPYLHWYTIGPSWALLAGVTVDKVFGSIQERCGPRSWSARLAWGPFALLLVLFTGYSYMYFIQQSPEYASTFPENKSPLYWTPQKSIPGGKGLGFQGVPAQTGWKVIGYLYRTGKLRGHLRVSSGQDTLEWYMGQQWDRDDNSKYILYADELEPAKANRSRADGLDLKAIERSYTLIGRIHVRGQPKMLLYEHKDTAKVPVVVDYVFEEYEPLYDRLDSLSGRLRFVEARGDSKTYYQAAALVEETSDPDDIVAFTDQAQVGPFSYHYTGELPYFVPSGTLSPDGLGEWLVGRPASQKVYILLWAAPGGDERKTWDTWLGKYGEQMKWTWHGQVGLAVYDPADESRLHLLQGARLGEGIDLLGYEVSPVSPARTVTVTLYWAASATPTQDYTVFTHVIDGSGRMWGQKDNQPVGGTRPTSTWRTDRVLRDEYTIPLGDAPIGEYWIEVGMYNAVTGERLSTSGEGAISEGRIRLPRPLNSPSGALDRTRSRRRNQRNSGVALW